VHRGGSLLCTESRGRGCLARSGVSISGAATGQEQEQRAAATIGVIRVMSTFNSQDRIK
jgi:hypothetical protein